MVDDTDDDEFSMKNCMKFLMVQRELDKEERKAEEAAWRDQMMHSQQMMQQMMVHQREMDKEERKAEEASQRDQMMHSQQMMQQMFMAFMASSAHTAPSRTAVLSSGQERVSINDNAAVDDDNNDKVIDKNN